MKVSNIVKDLFESIITPAMMGFKPVIADNSFVYTRTEDEAVQQIEFIPQISTKDREIVYLRIYPRINVYIKKINEMAEIIFKKCISKNYLDGSIRNATYFIPIDTTERKKRGLATMTSADCLAEAERVRTVVVQNALPMLDKLRTANDFILCWENNLLMYPHKFAIYIICAYILKGDYENAVKTAENYFRNTNNFEEYNALTEYIGNNCKSASAFANI